MKNVNFFFKENKYLKTFVKLGNEKPFRICIDIHKNIFLCGLVRYKPGYFQKKSEKRPLLNILELHLIKKKILGAGKQT